MSPIKMSQIKMSQIEMSSLNVSNQNVSNQNVSIQSDRLSVVASIDCSSVVASQTRLPKKKN
jgi:hypothetical protein